MAANIAALLDKAKLIHRLPSDYKLALVMGIRTTSITNYRQGKTLPDARIIGLLCELTGDDPALIAVEIEEQRATTTEARALWHRVAERLAAAGTTAVFAVAFVVSGLAGFPNEAQAATRSNSQLHPLYIVAHGRRRWSRLFRRLLAPLARYFRATGGSDHVQGAASIAAA